MFRRQRWLFIDERIQGRLTILHSARCRAINSAAFPFLHELGSLLCLCLMRRRSLRAQIRDEIFRECAPHLARNRLLHVVWSII